MSADGQAGGAAGWRVFFRVAYRFLRLIDPVIRLWWRARLPASPESSTS
jgi:hypothetical protein